MIFRSPRQADVLAYLMRHGSGTTRDIGEACKVEGVRDYIRRLRDKGYLIETIEEGVNEQGARVVRYRLLHSRPDSQGGDLFGAAPESSGVTYR